MNAMNAENRTFKGVLYFGLMKTVDGVKVIEYNCRFGDPETQVVLPRLKSDLCEIFNAVIDQRLDEIDIEWNDDACVCVVMASGGYPGSYKQGLPISGLEETAAREDVVVFHAGTKCADGQIVTAGGRVLGVTAVGKNIREAKDKAYEAAGKISFADAHYRKDIAWRALKK